MRESPRPSGWGSVEARGPATAWPRRARLPGHQAGAPLKRSGRRADARAARASPRPSGWGSVEARAIGAAGRPTAPCLPGHQAGAPLKRVEPCGPRPRAPPGLPGHQAGAPLKPRRRDAAAGCPRPSPRPSGWGSVEADARPPGASRAARSPRPSGWGSVEAPSRRASCTRGPRPSPRPSGWGSVEAPGGRGRPRRPARSPRPSGWGSVEARERSRGVGDVGSGLPGHQAGAPLKRGRSGDARCRARRVSPAIRLGLR